VIFLLKYHQNPQGAEHRTKKRENVLKKEKKKKNDEEEKKLQESSQIKEEVNILRGEKHFNFNDPFLCDSVCSPSIIPFEKIFPKSLRKFS
jgi:hypothetical protein